MGIPFAFSILISFSLNQSVIDDITFFFLFSLASFFKIVRSFFECSFFVRKSEKNLFNFYLDNNSSHNFFLQHPE